MKRLISILSAIALLNACAKLEDIDQPFHDEAINEIEASDIELPEVLYAIIADENEAKDTAATRTYVENRAVLWHNQDAISYFAADKHNVMYRFDGEDGASSAEFTLVPETGSTQTSVNTSMAVYPYDEGIVYISEDGIEKVRVNYPSVQTYAQNSFGKGANLMVASGNNALDDNLYFRNACGYLVVKLYGNTAVKRITLSSLDNNVKIAGPASIIARVDDAPVVEMLDGAISSVTMDCGETGVGLSAGKENFTEFWFALPPVIFENGFKIEVTDIYGNIKEKQTDKSVSIIRNQVQPMAPIEFVQTVVEKPAYNEIWYTRADGEKTPITMDKTHDYGYYAYIVQNYYDESNDRFVIRCGGPILRMPWYSFANKPVETVVLPEGLIQLDGNTFFYDDEHTPTLKSVNIPGSVIYVGYNVFLGCSSLESITFEPNSDGRPLRVECQQIGGTALDINYGTFADACNYVVNLDRDIEYIHDGEPFTPDEPDESLFYRAAQVNFGPHISRIPPYMCLGANMTELVIPDHITEVGEKAFSECQSLRKLTISDGVSTIGDSAFSYCEALEEVIIEDNVNPLSLSASFTIGLSGPFNRSPLKSIYLGRDITYIYKGEPFSPTVYSAGVFAVSSYIWINNPDYKASVTIGRNVKRIGDYMFSCLPIETLTIPNSVTSIGNHAFDTCEKLSNITIPDSVTSIGASAFTGCISLDNLTLPAYITSIGGSTFNNCRSLSSIDIPGTVTSIGLNAFYGCRALETITFEPSPLDLTDEGYALTIAYQADQITTYGPFYSSPLTTVNLNRKLRYTMYDNGNLTSASKGLFSNIETIQTVKFGTQVDELIPYTFTSTGITTIALPESLKSVGNYAFSDCDALTSVTVPATLTTVGNYMFYDCDGLESVVYNSSTIGPNAFASCDKLKSVTMGGTLPAIDKTMFSGCSALNTLKITGSVDLIGDGAFDGFALTTLEISGRVETIGENAFDDCDDLLTLNISGVVGTIGKEAFDDCDALSTVNVTGTVNKVGSYAFSDCDAVTSLAIRANIVDDYAYEDMDGLKTATLYGATVGKGVFYDSNNLEEVIIDGGVNSIGNDAFYNCGKLSKVTFMSSANSLTMGYQPSSTDDVGAFYQSPLAYIYLDREIVPSEDYKKELDAWDMGLFTNKHYNTDLKTTVTIGSNVKTILPWMFNCVRMEEITLPSSITSIGDEAFYYCRILDSVTLKGTNPPAFGKNVFRDCSKLGSIIVPAGYAETYRSASGWCDYASMIK